AEENVIELSRLYSQGQLEPYLQYLVNTEQAILDQKGLQKITVAEKAQIFDSIKQSVDRARNEFNTNNKVSVAKNNIDNMPSTNPKISPEVVTANAKLDPQARISKAKELVGKMNETQEKAILEALNQDGVVLNLNFSQLRSRVEILSKAGFTSDQIRVLLENGICGKAEMKILDVNKDGVFDNKDVEVMKDPITSLIGRTKQINNKVEIEANMFEVPLKDGKYEYVSKETYFDSKGIIKHKQLENITHEQAKECFFNGLDITAQIMEGQSQWAVLSSGSLFLHNPNYMKLGGDIDIATDSQTFVNVALTKGKNGKTKLEQFRDDGKIMDLKFTHIDHKEIDISKTSDTEIQGLIARGDIRVEFNIISKDNILINCELFPEPPGYGLIQLGTARTEGKVNTFIINGAEIKAVNEELAAKSYMINLAHEFRNNSLEGLQEGKKMKDAVRIDNFLQYLGSVGLKTSNDIISFIDKTQQDYVKQIGKEFTVNGKDGEIVKINMSQYLKDGLDSLLELKNILIKVDGQYKVVVLKESDSRGAETTISFNDFVAKTYEIKKAGFKGEITIEQALIAMEELKSHVNIKDPQNFAYYYEMYQLQTNFIEKKFEIDKPLLTK
ncbi:MAG TPA: hypothetical protein P5155_02720, partial [Candidatus Absconditabacterales bacterium]|nr:hypothetical protein [Candidatus Absconditabacterales bacterium]